MAMAPGLGAGGTATAKGGKGDVVNGAGLPRREKGLREGIHHRGSTWFRIRDLTAIIGFGIGFDAKGNNINVSTVPVE